MGRSVALLALLSMLAPAASAAPRDVKLPENWRETFVKYWEGDRAPPNDAQTGVTWANDIAVESARKGGPLAYGSVIVFEVWKAKLDAEGKPVLDQQGRRIPDSLALIAVMEKRRGAGAAWPEEVRNDDWEFAAFKPDGTFVDRDYTPCLECHKPLEDRDFLFTRPFLDQVAAGR